MPIDQYIKARNEGQKEVHACKQRGEDPALLALNELVPGLNRLSQVPIGLIQINLDQIAGTATKGRTDAFSKRFMPLLDQGSEFATKWVHLHDSVLKDGLREPVKAYEYYNQFYIIEGNKRVSVSRFLDAISIEADVIRVLPEPEDSERYRVYQEFLSFYKDTKINNIYFEHEGDFARLYELTGNTPGKPWAEESVQTLQSLFYRFCQGYAELEVAKAPMSPASAFLIYLNVFGYENSVDKMLSTLKPEIKRIASEFAVAASGKPAVLLNQPAEKQQSVIKSVLGLQPKLVRCAFLYNRSPQESGWTYWHELGRKALEETFGKRVETTTREAKSAEALSVIGELIREGYEVIFSTSPVFLDACITASAKYPKVKILNCSLLASYHNVRSYYLRIYEAKFLLGAIAGAMTENDRIGYIADYPIYGVPASINAFALGAQMTNPRAKIYLEWSTIPGIRPEEALRANEVSIISGRDISAPKAESREFGLYRRNGDAVHNLAMPVWNWQKLYEGIVRSILSGAWAEDASENADRAMSYYMGMSSEAIDVLCSKHLPAQTQRLIELLRSRICGNAFMPIVGPISDQGGALRVPQDTALDQQDIIRMDYLADNVIGRIPKIDELSDVAQGLVALQGLRSTASGPSPAERLRAAQSKINTTEDQ